MGGNALSCASSSMLSGGTDENRSMMRTRENGKSCLDYRFCGDEKEESAEGNLLQNRSTTWI
jgi:hypothetical protein